MNNSDDAIEPPYEGFVLFMDLLGYRDILAGTSDERKVLTAWYTEVSKSLRRGVEAEDGISVANLFSDSVYALADRPDPLLQVCQDMAQLCVRFPVGEDGRPMMVRGAIARGTVSTTPVQSPFELSIGTKGDREILFGNALALAYEAAERSGLKGARVQLLGDIKSEEFELTPADAGYREFLWPLHVYPKLLPTYTEGLLTAWRTELKRPHIAAQYASTAALIQACAERRPHRDLDTAAQDIQEFVDSLTGDHAVWADRLVRYRTNLPAEPFDDYLSLSRQRRDLFEQPTEAEGYKLVNRESFETTAEWADEWRKTAKEKETPVGVIFTSAWGTLLNEVVRKGGKQFAYLRWIPPSDETGVVVIARTEEHELVLISTYRHATRQVHLELPRGSAAGDDPLAAARHELLSETGYELLEPKSLGVIYPDTGLQTGAVHVIIGQARNAGPAQHEPAEAIIETILIPIADLDGKIGDSLRDGITLAAIAVARASGELGAAPRS